MTITKTVYAFLDSLEDNARISGWELFDIIYKKTNKHTYPSTLLKMCRTYCDIVGGQFECVDKRNSVYIFHKGKFILGNSILNGKE